MKTMSSRVIPVMVCALALTVPAAQAAETYQIDSAHSHVGFAVRHMVVSTVRGSFSDVSGTIVLDQENPEESSVTAEIDTATIDTNNDKRDKHLRSADFLDVETYPTITFESTDVTRSGDQWTATGDLTLRGVTREVEITFRLNGPVTDPWGNTRLGIEAEPLEIDRQEYGVSWSETLDSGGLVVSDMVTIDLAVEAVAAQESAE